MDPGLIGAEGMTSLDGVYGLKILPTIYSTHVHVGLLTINQLVAFPYLCG